jgi:hypothetical protein
MRHGTRIEFHGTPAMGSFPAVIGEQATICRWNTKINGPVKNHVGPNNGGWHVVKFADGGKLIAHESRFRVIDNRAA